MFASVVVLLTAWERVTSLGSLETQEAIRDRPRRAAVLLARPRRPGRRPSCCGSSCMVAAAAACATAILGWYVRKPDRSARLGLTLFAVVVFVAGIPAGGLAGSFVAAGAAMLWMQPGARVVRHRPLDPARPAPEKDRRATACLRAVDPRGRPTAGSDRRPRRRRPRPTPRRRPPPASPFGEPGRPPGSTPCGRSRRTARPTARPASPVRSAPYAATRRTAAPAAARPAGRDGRGVRHHGRHRRWPARRCRCCGWRSRASRRTS